MTNDQLPMSKDGTSRRDYLKTAWKALGLVAAAEFATVLVAFLWPRAKGEADQRAAVIEAGPVAEFTPASVTAFPRGRFYLVRLADGGFLALSSRCTHLGCSVPWNEKSQTLVISRFPRDRACLTLVCATLITAAQKWRGIPKMPRILRALDRLRQGTPVIMKEPAVAEHRVLRLIVVTPNMRLDREAE